MGNPLVRGGVLRGPDRFLAARRLWAIAEGRSAARGVDLYLMGPLGPARPPSHALKFDSPAIDAGWPADCALDDQRGVSRLIDGNRDGTANCDIGAFEYKPKVLEQPH